MLQGWWCYRGSTARSRSLMKTANICFASGMFKMDDRSRKNWGWICCAEVSKAPAMPGCYEHSEHLVHEHLFWVLCLLGQHWNCCSRDWELLRLLQKKKKINDFIAHLSESPLWALALNQLHTWGHLTRDFAAVLSLWGVRNYSREILGWLF